MKTKRRIRKGSSRDRNYSGMPGRYLASLGIHLGNHRPVDMRGVPQIPDLAYRLLQLGHRELPPDVQREADEAILAATRELQARKLAEAGGELDTEPDHDLSDFEE